MRRFVYYITPLSAIISFLITVIYSGNIEAEFYLVMVYPLLYGIGFILLCPGLYRKEKSGRVTVGIFLALQWLRLVLLPALGAISGYFTATGQLIDRKSAQMASVLMLFETFATFFVAYLILWRKTKHPQVQRISQSEGWRGISGNGWVYFLFVLFAAALFIYDGADRYTFIALDLSSEDRFSSMSDGSGVALDAIVDYGLSILVILLTYFSFEKYRRTGSKRYMYMSLLVALARICIINADAEGRLAILYPVGAFLLLLPKLYPAYKKTIIRYVVLVGGIVIGLMTVYKVFHAFFYDSYLEALQNNAIGFDAYDTASQVDVYFYGVRTVARNLYVSGRIDLDISTLFMDYLRNTFGIHYLFGDTLNTTIAKYNLYIYGGKETAGHLYSALAYGATYFTAFLAPMITIANMLIASGFEKWIQRTRNIDVHYIVSIVYIRVVYNMFACFPMAWNHASRTLVLGALVVGGASLFKSRTNTGNIPENRLKEAK